MARSSSIYYIAPSAIEITPNANGNAKDLAVYVESGTKIKVFFPPILALGTIGASYREWALAGKNRELADENAPYTIYARLRKPESDNPDDKAYGDGYIVFARQLQEQQEQQEGEGETQEKWKDPYVLSPNTSKDESAVMAGLDGMEYRWAALSEEQFERKGYWWVKLGTVSKPTGSGVRSVTLDTGILGTDSYNTEWYISTLTGDDPDFSRDWPTPEGGGGQSHGSTLGKLLKVNFPGGVGYAEYDRSWAAGTSLEQVLRDILYKFVGASVAVTGGGSYSIGTLVTLVALYNAGDTGQLTVPDWRWYRDGELLEGRTSSTIEVTAEQGTHVFVAQAVLSEENVVNSPNVQVTGTSTPASLTLTPPSREAEVGDTVTFDIIYNAGTSGVASPTFVASEGGSISGTTLTVTAAEGEQTITVTAKDGDDVLCSATAKVTGFWPWYGGKVAYEPDTAAEVIAAGKHQFYRSLNDVFEFTAQNWDSLAFAVPVTNIEVSQWTNDQTPEDYKSYVNNNNSNGGRKNIVINGKTYTVYHRELDNATAANRIYKFTIKIKSI